MTLSTLSMLTVSLMLAQPGGSEPLLAELPEVLVTADDTVIDRSCRVVIPAGVVIADAAGDGVIRIVSDGVLVEFAEGSVLTGGEVEGNWDGLSGVGVRVEGAAGVTLRNLRVRGFKVGVLAAEADRLTVDGGDFSDNYRQRLGSTPLQEDASDWLFPHRNDEREWVTRHGAALAVERSEGVVVRGLRVRRGQNGIVFDRVNGATVVDNDCSFLSGWGLALWRSSENTIANNAFDFCVRGHSEGVYNRGQDSAGILFFEQCNKNRVIGNSATHSGDGFFGFAGSEAIGESPRPEGAAWSYARVGCNDNLFLNNDFSYASAHGWEMTFSEGNILWENRIVGNAICGVWGGYSSETVIAHNEFRGNGGMPYGLEGGAINIEHGSRNLIFENDMLDNTAGVRLWWDDDGRVLTLPGVPNAGVVESNLVTRNRITVRDASGFSGPRHEGRVFRGLWIQDPSGTHTKNTLVGDNQIEIALSPSAPVEVDPGVLIDHPPPGFRFPDAPFAFPIGQTEPIGARARLAGRENIVMGEWGPWDHESPMLRLRERGVGRAVYEVFGVGVPAVGGASAPGTSVHVEEVVVGPGPRRARITVANAEPGVHAYRLSATDPASGWDAPIAGTLVNAQWEVRVWSWEADPMGDLEAWRAEGEGEGVERATLPGLDLAYQARGPADLGVVSRERAEAAGIGRDRFAMIASTRVPLRAGRWKVRVVSDDGVRVLVDGAVRLERWDIHGPTPDEFEVELDEPREVTLEVEHFERDGWAALSVTIEPGG